MSDDLNKIAAEQVNAEQEQSTQNGEQPISETVENVTSKLGDALGAAVEKIKDAVQEVAEKVKEAAPELMEKAKAAAATLQEKAKDLVDKANDAVDNFQEKAKDVTADIAEKVKDASGKVEETVQKAFEKPEKEEKPAEPAAEREPEIDFSEKSLKELVDALKEYVDNEDMRSLNKYAEVIKACFYKNLKKEKLAMGFDEVAEEAVKASIVADAPAAEEAPAEAAEAPAEPEAAATNPFAELERGFKEVYGKYRNMRAEFMNEQNSKREENYEAKAKILADLKALVEEPGDLSQAYPKFRELQNTWRTIGPVPPAKAKDLYDSYYHNVEVFYDYVKINNELREMDFKKNLEAKEELCKKAEALAESENSVQSFRALQKLHEEWKELGPVAKEMREEIWERFRAATAKVNKKYQAFFESAKEKQVANLKAKTELCEKAEAIANSDLNINSNWAKLTAEMQELQKEWRTIGFSVKKENEKIYERFRAACDKFFTAKKQFHSDFKDQLAANLAKKEELCEKAEAVKDSEDWKKTSDILINLQKQWKEIGPVPKKKSDQVWNRFRAACDAFFENKDKHNGGKGASLGENLTAKKELIAAIEAFELAGDHDADLAAMRDFQAKWREIGFIPFKEKDKIQNAYRDALKAKFGELTEERPPRRREFQERPTRAAARPVTEKDRLIQEFVKLEQDIATWENNIGFFEKSKNAESLVSDYRAKIEDAKKELAALEAKIKSMNKAEEEPEA